MTKIEDEFFSLTETQKEFVQKQYKIFRERIKTDEKLMKNKREFDTLLNSRIKDKKLNLTEKDIEDLLHSIQTLSNLDWAYGQIKKALEEKKLLLSEFNEKLYHLFINNGERPEFYKFLIEFRALNQIGLVTSSQISCFINNEKNPLYTDQQWSIVTEYLKIPKINKSFLIQEDPDFYKNLYPFEKRFLYKIYILSKLRDYINSLDSEPFDFFQLSRFLWRIYDEQKKSKREVEVEDVDVDSIEINHSDLINQILEVWERLLPKIPKIEEKKRVHFDLIAEKKRTAEITKKVKSFIVDPSASETEFISFWNELYSAQRVSRASRVILANQTDSGAFDVEKLKRTLKEIIESDEYKTEWEHKTYISGARKTLWELFGVLHPDKPIVNNCSRHGLDYLLNQKTVDDYYEIRKAIEKFKKDYLDKIGHVTSSSDIPEEIRSSIYEEIDKLFNVIHKAKMDDYEKAGDTDAKKLFELVSKLKGTYKLSTSFDGLEIESEIEAENLIFENKNKLINRINTALKTGKNVILIGPPGTGKTKLATVICDSLKGKGNYKFCTATSDWSTFDTIGGYRLQKDKTLKFEPGLFLQCFIKKDKPDNRKWLIIDELNRADIDKAFGALFSLLTGENVTLSFIQDDKQIELMADYKSTNFESETYRYYIPEDFRIIGTMNTYDKSSLYEMSYAFMRRFAFIMVDIPIIQSINPQLIEKYIKCWEKLDIEIDPALPSELSELWKCVIKSKRKIGPAIIRDIYFYIKNTEPRDYVGAITMYILPQFEGLLERDIIDAVKALRKLNIILSEYRDELNEYSAEFFNIDPNLLKEKEKVVVEEMVNPDSE